MHFLLARLQQRSLICFPVQPQNLKWRNCGNVFYYGPKHQMLRVCGGGLVQSLHQMMHLTTVWLNLMECFHRLESSPVTQREETSASATDLIRNSLALVFCSLFSPPFTDPHTSGRRLPADRRHGYLVCMFWPIFLSAYEQKYVSGVFLVAENLTGRG